MLKSNTKLFTVLFFIFSSSLCFAQFATHTVTTTGHNATINGNLVIGSTAAGSFTVTNGSMSAGYAESNNPEGKASTTGVGANYNGISLQFDTDDTCIPSNGCDQGPGQGDAGSDVIELTYSPSPNASYSIKKIRVSQRLDAGGGNDEASVWTFTWSGGGTATWHDPTDGSSTATLYRFVSTYDEDTGSGYNPTNGESYDPEVLDAFLNNWNLTDGEIEGTGTSGTITSGGSLKIYATNNNSTKWYIDFPVGATSVTVKKVANTAATGDIVGRGTRLPVLGYGNGSSTNVNPGCSSTCDGDGEVTQLLNNGATYNEWVSFGVELEEAPAPVTLLNFSAENKLGSTVLFWTTSDEVNNSHFEVEKSLDGLIFEKIGVVKGAGNSVSSQSYSFVDSKANFNSRVFYRLKQVDFDGTFSFSPVKEILYKSNNSGILIHPNPVSDNLVITSPKQVDINVEIFDLTGKSIHSSKDQNIDMSTFKAGMYIVKVYNSNYKLLHSSRITKMK